jgi:oligosaccharide repeat unit polymerase
VLGRGRYGDLRSVLLSLEVLITAASPLAFLLLLRGKLFFPQHVLATVVCLWPPIRAVGSGYRSAMIQTTGALAAVIFWRAKPPVQRTLVVLFLVSILPMYYLMGSIGDSRSGGFSEFQFRTDATWYGYEMFRELEFITTKFPDTEPYWMGYSYYIQLINPIPRFLWPDKPKAESGLIMAKLYNEIDPNTGEPFMTISPGIIGEMYMNFGFPGVVALSLIGGWIIRGWDHLVETYSHSTMVMIFYSVGLVTIFVAGRAVNMPQLYSIILVAAMAFISVPSVAKERRRQAMIAATAPTT